MGVYPRLDGLDRRTRAAIEDRVGDDETFCGGIDCRTFLPGRATKLLLTDRRILVVRSGPRGGVVAYDRETVSTASVHRGLLFGRLSLSGAGIRASFRVAPGDGWQFAAAFRNPAVRVGEADRTGATPTGRGPETGVDEASDPEGFPPTGWSRWHYGVVAGAAVLLAGAVIDSLVLLVLGYVAVPVALYLDIRYVESRARWQPDRGLYLVGALLFLPLIVPIYLYRRSEEVGL